jgi:hypothetical protein
MSLLLLPLVSVIAVNPSPAFAEGTGCPASGCVGAFPSDTNCEDDAAKYPIATAPIFWSLHTENSRISLVYSPLCSTYWGSVDGLFTGYPESLTVFGQDQYGGREKLLYSQGSTENSLSAIETKMVAAGPGSIKFCASNGDSQDDPDLDPSNNSDQPLANCTDWR